MKRGERLSGKRATWEQWSKHAGSKVPEDKRKSQRRRKNRAAKAARRKGRT